MSDELSDVIQHILDKNGVPESVTLRLLLAEQRELRREVRRLAEKVEGNGRTIERWRNRVIGFSIGAGISGGGLVALLDKLVG